MGATTKMEVKCSRCNTTLALIDCFTAVSLSLRCHCGARYHLVSDKTGELKLTDVTLFLTDVTLDSVEAICKDPMLTPMGKADALNKLADKANAMRRQSTDRIRAAEAAYGKVVHEANKAIKRQELIANEQAANVFQKREIDLTKLESILPPDVIEKMKAKL